MQAGVEGKEEKINQRVVVLLAKQAGVERLLQLQHELQSPSNEDQRRSFEGF